jgi:hypothetical protein
MVPVRSALAKGMPHTALASTVETHSGPAVYTTVGRLVTPMSVSGSLQVQLPSEQV